MQKQLEQVKEFHEKFECPVLENPELPANIRRGLRMKLLLEEVAELTQAFFNDDLVNAAGELMDILYVTYGTLHEIGMGAKAVELFDEVHRSNMSKLDAEGKPVKRADGKVIKSDLFTPHDLGKILNS